MSLLSAHGLRKSYGVHQVLAGVDVAVAERERIGLVGDNGSGKSTLVRILAGLEPADSGEIMSRRGSRVGYLEQAPDLPRGESCLEIALGGLSEWKRCRHQHEEVTRQLSAGQGDTEALLVRQAELAAEIERLGGWDHSRRAASMLERLGVSDPTLSPERFSGGEARRVALARLLVASPDLMVLDEPTNHLDLSAIDWLEQYLLESFRGALVLITHDRYFLDRVVDRTWEISAGEVRSYQGGWESYLIAKAEREALDARTEANRRNFLRTELEWLRRQPKARGTKQKARVARAEEAASVVTTSAGELALEAASLRQGSSVAKLSDVGVCVEGRTLFSGLDLILMPGHRLGVIGPNGCGKTTLLRTITGELAPSQGCVELGKNTRIAYLSQSRDQLDDALSIAECVAGKRTEVTVAGQEMTIYSYLGRFLFRGEELRKKVGTLSGGERARVALAKLLLQPANLLILDEPTNDLDVTTMSSLEEMLRQFAGSAVVVTHDRYFLDRVATAILAFEGPGELTHTVGGYETYTRLRRERAQAARERAHQPEQAKATAAPAKAAARPVKLSYKEQKELEGIEEAIESAEQHAKQLEAKLADPTFYQEHAVQAAGLGEELKRAQREAQRLMDRWQELESKREAFEAARK